MKNKKLRILICDDDKYFRMALKDLIIDDGLVDETSNESQAQELLAKNHYDLAIIDMNIDGPLSGIKILKLTKLRRIHSIILSSQTNDEIIEQAYENGCDHFLSKSQYRTYLAPYILKYKKNHFENDLTTFFDTKYLTQDEELKNKIQELCKINLKNKSIFITGETGVGKSLIGELLHHQTYDSNRPYIHLNCAEIPENLIESELFGHEKGSFTGADSKKIGKLELANGGTLFLDEIGTMPLSMQQKLLKALDQKNFYPVGSNKPTYSEYTLISATCDNLFEKILKDEFRKDLFFRVSGINLDIKPLRYRRNDIPLLIRYFIQKSHRRFIIKEDAIEKLSQYDWPGNTRELKKKIDLLSTTEKGIIRGQDLQLDSQSQLNQNNVWLTSQQKEFISQNGLREFITLIEEECLKTTLEKNQGKITRTIKDLGISASAFYRIFNKTQITI